MSADSVHVRAVRDDDLERIGEITAAAWRPVYEGHREDMGEALFSAKYGDDWEAYKTSQVLETCRTEPENVLVAVVDGTVVGYACLSADEDTGVGRIRNNAVDPGYQGKGIGTRLYEHVLAELESRGMAFAEVSTGLAERFAPARRAYEQLGFEVERRSVTYFQEL